MDNFLGKFSYTFSTIILWGTYEQLLSQGRRNEKNSGRVVWGFIKKCWTNWLAD